MYVHANLCIAIIQSPQNQSACEGETVNFMCVIMFPVGSTPGSPSWFDIIGSGVPSTDDSNGRPAPANVTSIFTVTNISISDNEDGYLCAFGVGMNQILSNASFLTVIGKPYV